MHTGEKPFKCDYCDYASAQMCNLQAHIRCRHTGEKPYKCDQCDYAAAQYGNLYLHIRSKHCKDKPFKCEQCDYQTVQHGHLMTHIRSRHTGEKPYKCPYCEYASAQAGHLQVHIRCKHSGVKPFKCEKCDYASVDQRGLQRHINSKHTDVKPFKCTYCDYSSCHEALLQMHVRCKHVERPFKCEQCNYAGLKLCDLQRHIRYKHSPVDRPFQCQLCDYASNRKSDLHRHVRLRHPEQASTSDGDIDTSAKPGDASGKVEGGGRGHQKQTHGNTSSAKSMSEDAPRNLDALLEAVAVATNTMNSAVNDGNGPGGTAPARGGTLSRKRGRVHRVGGGDTTDSDGARGRGDQHTDTDTDTQEDSQHPPKKKRAARKLAVRPPTSAKTKHAADKAVSPPTRTHINPGHASISACMALSSSPATASMHARDGTAPAGPSSGWSAAAGGNPGATAAGSGGESGRPANATSGVGLPGALGNMYNERKAAAGLAKDMDLDMAAAVALASVAASSFPSGAPQFYAQGIGAPRSETALPSPSGGFTAVPSAPSAPTAPTAPASVVSSSSVNGGRGLASTNAGVGSGGNVGVGGILLPLAGQPLPAHPHSSTRGGRTKKSRSSPSPVPPVSLGVSVPGGSSTVNGVAGMGSVLAGAVHPAADPRQTQQPSQDMRSGNAGRLLGGSGVVGFGPGGVPPLSPAALARAAKHIAAITANGSLPIGSPAVAAAAAAAAVGQAVGATGSMVGVPPLHAQPVPPPAALSVGALSGSPLGPVSTLPGTPSGGSVMVASEGPASAAGGPIGAAASGVNVPFPVPQIPANYQPRMFSMVSQPLPSESAAAPPSPIASPPIVASDTAPTSQQHVPPSPTPLPTSPSSATLAAGLTPTSSSTSSLTTSASASTPAPTVAAPGLGVPADDAMHAPAS